MPVADCVLLADVILRTGFWHWMYGASPFLKSTCSNFNASIAMARGEGMAESPPQHPMALAMQWVARITAAGLMMVLPGLAGQWLDGWLGTGALALCGFAVGITVSIAYLVAITKPPLK
jgi:hypothetical protein